MQERKEKTHPLFFIRMGSKLNLFAILYQAPGLHDPEK